MSGEVKINIGRKLNNGELLTYDVLRDVLDGLTAEVLAGTLTAREIADGTIPESKLSAAVRSQLGLPDGAVTLAKIADGCLTADSTGRAKMADGFVTAAKIAANAVTATQLASNLVWPVGVVQEFGGETAPTGWFECNGAAVSRSTYSALFGVIGVLWGVGNGTTTFNLPDLRGYFARGWDHGAGNDLDAAFRTGGDHVGSVQADELKAHTHNLVSQNVTYTVTTATTQNSFFVGGTVLVPSLNTGGNETRPKNKNLMYVIKW